MQPEQRLKTNGIKHLKEAGSRNFFIKKLFPCQVGSHYPNGILFALHRQPL